MVRKIKVIALAFIAFASVQASWPADTVQFDLLNRKKLNYTLAASAINLAGMTILLNEAWYKNHDRSSFHFYDDSGEWLQMDKAGHFFTSYALSLAGIELIRNTGMGNTRAVWYGSLYGPVFLSVIEVLDGFSAEWGFSIADMAANFAGTGLAVSQELLTGRQTIRIKYSYRHSSLAQYRPEMLGRNLPERMLKDYNGQAYWISANISDLTGIPGVIPDWLNIAFGYSANGMLGGYSDSYISDGIADPLRYRQFFLAPDIDLSKIHTKSRTVKSILKALNFLKTPAPALEYNRYDGLRLHLFFF
ncbi:MAG: DUF2279 domain-containing protein [Bacteroidales bacterium]